MKAYVDSVVSVRKKAIDVEAVKKALTVKHFSMGAVEPTLVYAFTEDDHYLYIPRHYGLQLISDIGAIVEDRRVAGLDIKYPVEVEHTGAYAYQQPFVASILQNARSGTDFIAQAATGKGKTVCSLSVIQKLGKPALVIVDQDNLMQQWLLESQKVLGLTAAQIGKVQGKVCSYEGKHVVVAMMQSLVQREYPSEFYEYFGTVVFDEVHTAGAPTFSTALMMFPAAVRFGVSATVDRRDDLQKILHWNLGNVEVSLTDKHDKSIAYYVESGTVYSWYANISPKTGRILTEVSEDPIRNQLLVNSIKWLYETGRDILVISDRIEQLENLRLMAYYEGIPLKAMGIYCGNRNIWVYEKDPSPKRRPEGYVKGTEYTPVKLTKVRKRIPKKELEQVKEKAKIIFATFGMFSKGVDVPRLSGGVDCTPRSKAQQVHGRILRKQEGKDVPVWVTVRDINSYRVDYQFLQRIDEYVSSSAEIYQWKQNKGVRLQDVRELKRTVHQNVKRLKAMNITTCADGSFMLETPTTPKEPAGHRGTHTAKTTRYR